MTGISSNEQTIETTRVKIDLGVNVNDDLKSSGHKDRMVAKASRI